MGQSTNAILFYGYVWDEEAELWDRDRYDEWFEVLAKRRGITSPWYFYRESGAEAIHNGLPFGQHSAAYEAWKEKVGFEAMLEEWDGIKSAIKAEHPTIGVASHCSCDYPMPYIYISETGRTATRGFPEALDLTKMPPAGLHKWDVELNDFIDALEIDVSDAQGPGWFLVSNWC